NVPVTIVGVLDPAFTGIQTPLDEAPDVGLPLALDGQLNLTSPGPTGAQPQPRLSQPTYWWLQAMGRVNARLPAGQVEGNLGAVFQNTARTGLDTYLKSLTDKERSASYNQGRTRVPKLLVQPGDRGIYDVNTNDLRSMTILSVVVALVLLIVCANVA